jgi:hypothetical protein
VNRPIATSIPLYTEPEEQKKIVHEIREAGLAKTAAEAEPYLRWILWKTKAEEAEEVKRIAAKHWKPAKR